MLHTLTSLIIAILPLLGIIVHIVTIVLAHYKSGWFASTTTLMFPVLAEGYWFLKIGFSDGFLSGYCMMIWFLLGTLFVAFVGMMTTDKFDHHL